MGFAQVQALHSLELETQKMRMELVEARRQREDLQRKVQYSLFEVVPGAWAYTAVSDMQKPWTVAPTFAPAATARARWCHFSTSKRKRTVRISGFALATRLIPWLIKLTTLTMARWSSRAGAGFDGLCMALLLAGGLYTSTPFSRLWHAPNNTHHAVRCGLRKHIGPEVDGLNRAIAHRFSGLLGVPPSSSIARSFFMLDCKHVYRHERNRIYTPRIKVRHALRGTPTSSHAEAIGNAWA